MQRTIAVLGAVLTAGLLGLAGTAAAEEEADLIGVLQSDKGPQEKDAACRRLKVVGTAKAVPALAALLTNEELSQSARLALEPMAYPEVGAALRQALTKAAGKTKAGLVDSLGQRRDREALPALVELLGDPDAQMASSAAAALGRIGGPEAVRALNAAKTKAAPAQRLVLADALLLCADGLLTAGDQAGASAIYKEVHDSETAEQLRVAAHRGVILSSAEPPALVHKALVSKERTQVLAALPLVREIKSASVEPFTLALKDSAPDLQAAIIEALAQRGDPAAVPAIVVAVGSADPAVRVAALRALGALGDGAVVPVLAEAAGKAQGPEQEAARQALVLLKGQNVPEAILAHLGKAEPPARLALIQALRYRRDAAAVPALRKAAADPDASIRAIALQALAAVADGALLPAAVELLVKAQSDAERREAADLVAACARKVADEEARAAPVLAALSAAAGPARAALLSALPCIGGVKALEAARAALKDADEAVRDAAVRALGEWPDAACAADLLKLAQEAPSETQRVLALRGYLRLIGLPSERSAAQTARKHTAALQAARRIEEKKLVLASLAKVWHPEALKVAEACLADPELKSEAGAAALAIARGFGGADREAARAAVEKLLASAPDEALRKQATETLAAMSRFEDFIVSWLVSGPYTSENKGPQELFDVAFAPEKPDSNAKWRPLENATSAENPVIVDLQKALATENCVAYLKVQIVSPKAQESLLELGSDDGVKAWLNGTQVCAHNILRPCEPGQEKVKVSLKEGANVLMLKITQGNMGWGACARFRAPAGGKLEGLLVRAE
jgi:HEAT repeat protein